MSRKETKAVNSSIPGLPPQKNETSCQDEAFSHESQTFTNKGIPFHAESKEKEAHELTSEDGKGSCEHEEKPTFTVVQNIRSINLQAGNNNKIYDCSAHTSERPHESDSQEKGAEVVNLVTRPDGSILTQNIAAKHVNINFPGPEVVLKETYSSPQGIQTFLEKVNNFDSSCHYILVVDRLTGIHELEAFSLVDWIAVIDFDPESRKSGLLSYVEESISQKQSLHIVSWQEEKCTFSDNSLYWIGIKGCAGQPDTKTSDNFQNWKRGIKSTFLQQIKQLKRFGHVYTQFVVVALWPHKSCNYKHIQFVLNEMNDSLCPKEIVIVNDGSKKSKEAESVLNLLTDDFSTVTFGVLDVCKAISTVLRPYSKIGSSAYQLPTFDFENDPKIDDQKAQWLKEDLHVLYLTNETGLKYDAGLEEEEINFFRGATLPWGWWYEVGPGQVDIQREISHDIIRYIKTKHIDVCRSGCIKIFHNPGSGGTTLSQRVVWSLKNDVPCVQIKHRSSSATIEIAEKIEFLYDKTRRPVLVLIDGGDEQKVESLQGILGGHCCIIILYVKRYLLKIDDKTCKTDLLDGVFWLPLYLSDSESKTLKHLYSSRQCTSDGQRRKLEELKRDGQNHSVFDFGFAMYSYEYKGIESYVHSYLKWDTNDGQRLQTRQKALAYLSLVYYYGQASLPCQFFAYLLEIDNASHVTTFDDIPNDVKALMVQDIQDRRKNVVRVAHYYIAKEILDQVLVYPKKIERPIAPTLSVESKKSLASFAVEFIKKAGERNQEEPSSTVSYIMTRTFILRDGKTVGENETQVIRRKQQFSQILEDVSSLPPFTERFTIYQALTESFPSESQFRAHLGRLYSHCRPDEIYIAEKCFKEALETCRTCLHEDLPDEMPLSDIPLGAIPYNNKLDLMHIYHMYGNMLMKQIGIYTGRYFGDMASVQTKQNFDEKAAELLPKVKQACELFSKCRNITPVGCEGSFGYIGEIQIRLMFCDYVHRNCGCRDGILKYIRTQKNDIVKFVNECIPILYDLYLSCCVEPEKMDENVKQCIRWHSALFNKGKKYADRKCAHDAKSRRFEIAKVKMKYCQTESYGILEHVDDANDVQFIVREFEKNFKDYENKSAEILPTKRAMDLDYREWLLAIRHRLFEESYSVGKVLQQVQLWHDTLHTPHSLFYLFVIKSLYGIGNCQSQGDTALLQDAQHTKEEMIKRSKHVRKPRYLTEWLGKPENNIRQLVSGHRFFGQVEGRDIKIGSELDTLEIWKGTICSSNDKSAGGYIDLDLGPDNRVPLKVFFVPARSAGNLKGSGYISSRVEFVIGFSHSHGYEAFNVRVMEYEKCTKCKKNVEKRTCDREVQCPRCRILIPIEKPRLQTKQGGNGGSRM